MLETTADAHRRGLYNPDYYINETNKHIIPPTLEETNLRKECKSSKHKESFISIFFLFNS